jgi:hypothetical protein
MKGRPEATIDKVNKSLFGIALSGGGIRSATLNFGFLQVLNDCGILKKADYLSTVPRGQVSPNRVRHTSQVRL